MSVSTNSPPNPIPQERCADAFKQGLKKKLAMVDAENDGMPLRQYLLLDG
jgi:hypothetical protein